MGDPCDCGGPCCQDSPPAPSDVLPGLTRSELTETISTAVLFAVVAALIWPFTDELLRPAAERLYNRLAR